MTMSLGITASVSLSGLVCQSVTSYCFGLFGIGSADSLTRRGVVAEPIGPARGGDIIDAAGWVEGGGVTSAFLSSMTIHWSSY